jgi:dTDP-4-amino-4,6-dideoxygalactose transaminase
LWNGIKPVFVDVEPDTLNIDPSKIEAAITPRSTAILAVHCYGRPCDIDAIQKIADTYNLKVIYDSAHAFGVKCHCGSVLNHGDLSVLSFHATKVFNTFEGGAIVCPDLKTKVRIDLLKNFGYSGETNVVAPGINGKMSEFNAAFGLLQLRHIDKAIQRRKQVSQIYRKSLAAIRGVRCLSDTEELGANYAYFPILLNDEYPLKRDDLFEKMKDNGFHPRRYFYPLISEFPMYRGLSSSHPDSLPIAYKAASSVLCLPIYPDLSLEKVHEICDFIGGQS